MISLACAVGVTGGSRKATACGPVDLSRTEHATAVMWLCKGWHADRSPRVCGANHINPSEPCMAHMTSSDLQCSTAWKIDRKSIWVWLPSRSERRDRVIKMWSFSVNEGARLGLAQPRHIVRRRFVHSSRPCAPDLHIS